jgi:DNA-binding response OmpR family regulator
MASEHVLVVDDEPRYLRVIRFNLEAGGYLVTCAATGEEALGLLRAHDPDLMVLDIMLPDIDGFEVCRRARELSDTPIIMLTAKGADEDKIKGLRLGADDYVTKPFSAEELVARVEAVLRRVHAAETSPRQPTLVVGDLGIDFLARRVTARGREVRLSPTEYRLLTCLAARPGTVLTHQHLLETVWGPAYRGEHEILRIALWRLRHKLEKDPSNPRTIITRPGVGYMLSAPAQSGSSTR